MVTKVGCACGFCPVCGKKICRPHSADIAVCDCWEYCQNGHKMQTYTPDATPQTYGPIESGVAYGDLQHPMSIVVWCPICRYYSAQRPVEVKLS